MVKLKTIQKMRPTASQQHHDFGREAQITEQKTTEIRVTVADNNLLKNKFKTGTSLADAYKNKSKKTTTDYIDLGKWE